MGDNVCRRIRERGSAIVGGGTERLAGGWLGARQGGRPAQSIYQPSLVSCHDNQKLSEVG